MNAKPPLDTSSKFFVINLWKGTWDDSAEEVIGWTPEGVPITAEGTPWGGRKPTSTRSVLWSDATMGYYQRRGNQWVFDGLEVEEDLHTWADKRMKFLNDQVPPMPHLLGGELDTRKAGHLSGKLLKTLIDGEATTVVVHDSLTYRVRDEILARYYPRMRTYRDEVVLGEDWRLVPDGDGKRMIRTPITGSGILFDGLYLRKDPEGGGFIDGFKQHWSTVKGWEEFVSSIVKGGEA